MLNTTNEHYNLVYYLATNLLYEWTCFGSFTIVERGASDYKLLKLFGLFLTSCSRKLKPRFPRHKVSWLLRIENSLADDLHRHGHFLLTYWGWDSTSRWQMMEIYDKIVGNTRFKTNGTMRIKDASIGSIQYLSNFSEFKRPYSDHSGRVYAYISTYHEGSGEIFCFSDNATSIRSISGRTNFYFPGSSKIPLSNTLTSSSKSVLERPRASDLP